MVSIIKVPWWDVAELADGSRVGRYRGITLKRPLQSPTRQFPTCERCEFRSNCVVQAFLLFPVRWRLGGDECRTGRSSATAAPHVGIIMGSRSDWATMQQAAEMLKRFDVAHECRVVSAHRTPEWMCEYADGRITRDSGDHCRCRWSRSSARNGRVANSTSCSRSSGSKSCSVGIGLALVDCADAGRHSRRYACHW